MKLVLILVILNFSCSTVKIKKNNMDPGIFANLGDGVNVDHFYFIEDKLFNRKTSLKIRNDILENYRRSKEENLKSWFSSMVETQFSHVITKLVKANDLKRAAVYDRFGIAIGYSDSSFGKEGGGLPLFYETEEVETYMKIKKVLFKQIKHDSFYAIRPIRSPDRKVLGFSVVNFKTDKFTAPSIQ